MEQSLNLDHALHLIVEFSVDIMASPLVRLLVQIRWLCKHKLYVFTLMIISKFKRKDKIQKNSILC